MIDPEILLGNSLRGNFTDRYPSPPPGGKLSAVLILLRLRKDAWELFFTRRSEQLANHRGQIAFPGGRAEPGDSGPLQTALREACEEVGIAPDAVKPIGILDPLDTSSGFRVWPVIGILRMPVDPRPSSPEVAEAFWIPLDWLAAEGRWEWRIMHADENHNPAQEDTSQVIASDPFAVLEGRLRERSNLPFPTGIGDCPEEHRTGFVASLLAMTSSLFPHPVGEQKAVFFEPYQGHVIWGATAAITIQLLDRLKTGGSG